MTDTISVLNGPNLAIVGFGPLGCVLALDAALHLCKGAGASQVKSRIQ